MDSELSREIEQKLAERRTFAIISHPDAGKTTLTEKLLLYSGMLRTAGMVRSRKGGRSTSSDWMALEQERGISISASAMQFRYKDSVINVLDTPGHQDFSEDTYRTLTAADSAVMVLDAAKGVEEQTKKLFAVCHLRQIPILTFINKMDLPSREPLELLEEVEDVLKIQAVPMNWPVGFAKNFVGVADCQTKIITLFEKGEKGGAEKASFKRLSIEEAKASCDVEREVIDKLEEDLELLEGAGNTFSREEFLAGKKTPVYFGSALTNFGIEPFFDSFVRLASEPRPVLVDTSDGKEKFLDPATEPFSGFVFKVQANVNPRHRDSMAYIRICSGRFERDMTVKHHNSGKELRLSRSYSLVAKDRETIDLAYPGDIVGVSNPGVFSIGDTVSVNGGFLFKPMPRFAPELVARIRPKDVMKLKSFEKGIDQLASEGAIQILIPVEESGGFFAAAIGQLQYEVLEYRLKAEYNVDTVVEMLSVKHCAFLIGDPKTFKKTQSARLAQDRFGRMLVLFTGEWERRYSQEQNPNHSFEDYLA